MSNYTSLVRNAVIDFPRDLIVVEPKNAGIAEAIASIFNEEYEPISQNIYSDFGLNWCKTIF